MITSVKNEKVKEWTKLKQKKGRDQLGLFLVEGFHLIEEAHKSDCNIVEIIHTPKATIDYLAQYKCVEVTENVLQKITDTKSPQGVVAVVEKKLKQGSPNNRVLLLDNVQDPGNVGTMIRTADAAGFDTVVLGKGSVDVFNDKVIRATQGSIFHLSIYQADLLEEIAKLKENGVTVWATGLENATNMYEMPITEKMAIIVGNEGAGVHPSLMKEADEIVTIPIYGQAESLNVSIAAAVLMYHVVKL
ncbi:TrmH family RNA methyltransferase [Gracilibacillus marinus]|uniref:TrmH family RNA methyltransferase n=1 Tax=Gracilibacillus marinus TaxID=630535 RepID=A0ABV8VUS8_9BACI